MNSKIESYFNGEMNKAERLSFLREINSNKELKEAFINYRNLSGLISLKEHETDNREGNISYSRFISGYNSRIRRKKIIQYARYAAMLALFFATAWATSYYYYSLTEKTQITFNKLTVPAGQRASLTLSDGTEVWLNARSTLIYPTEFGKNNREVKLSGEAYFNVTKNKKPFLVSSNSLNIKVLGTSFNVYDYIEDDSVNISLVNGSIEITEPGIQEKGIIMEPNQTLHYKAGKINITQGINEENFLWIQGVYVFNETNLLDIVNKLELYYDTRIIVKNPDLSKRSYTGKFRQRDSVIGILQILQEIHDFKITKDEINNMIIIE